VQSLKSAARTTLVHGADVRYLPTGHIVYAHGGLVFAVRFDLARLAIVGGPAPVIEGVRRGLSGVTGAAQFSVSDHGTLVYVPGPHSPSEAQLDLAFMDRQGALQRLKLPAASYEHPCVSPDGTRVAVGTDNGKDANVWVYDLSGLSSRRQLTVAGRNEHPTWSADGQRVAFASNRDGDHGIFWQRADGAGVAERLTTPEPGTAHIPESWAPDGKTFLFTEARRGAFSLWTFSLQDRKATPYGDVEATLPISAEFSPDGRCVAYASTGVFVQPFPATGVKYLIHGGIHPFWSPDGTELFSGAVGRFAVGNFAVVSIRAKPTFTVGNPVEISRAALREIGPFTERNVDVMPGEQAVRGRGGY
jgi:dipeptidyl aminopeptidase/acylaminoacyl peptidase